MVRRIFAACAIVLVCVLCLPVIILFTTQAHSPDLFRTIIKARCFIGMHNTIVPGKDGWLFFKPELDYAVLPIPSEDAQSIIDYDRLLREKGIALIVVPIPNKLEIYPEKFSWITVPHPVKPELSELLRQLQKAGVIVVDLIPPFERAKKDFIVYDPAESHWTSLGIEVAAREIGKRVDSLLAVRGIPQTTIYSTRDTIRLCYGDLLQKLTGNENAPCHPLLVRQVFEPDGTPYKDDLKSGIMIVGDSFVDHMRWYNSKLGAHLARFIKHPTYTFFSLSANTCGPCMYQRKPEAFPKKGIVIWAFTSRAFQWQLCSPRNPSCK
jgi:hypothetical protein